MNIIKFKDIIIEGDELFNAKFKGKYAYWVRMQYAISFNDMSTTDYVRYETYDDLYSMVNEDGVDYLCTDKYSEYIDYYETDRANKISRFILKNSFAPDEDITLEEIKKFRTWLASTLLNFEEFDVGTEEECVIFDEQEKHVLEYYKNGMYNEVVKFLGDFGTVQTTASILSQSTSPCSCQNNYNTSMVVPTISTCDPLYIYKNNIYKKMVEMFGNAAFWMNFDNGGFIEEFKKYIDNILQCGLLLYKSQYISDFVDCGCDTTNNQAEMVRILQNLSQSLQYIIDKDFHGHKNFMNDSFDKWARYLYENMEW